MDDDPLLPISTQPILHPILRRKASYLLPLLEDDEVSPSSLAGTPSFFKDRLIFGPAAAAGDPSAASSSVLLPPPEEADEEEPEPTEPATRLPLSTKKQLHRCRTAPAMSNIREIFGNAPWKTKDSDAGAGAGDGAGGGARKSTNVIGSAFVFLLIYLGLGVAVYTMCRRQFSAEETSPVVDALYFSIVTMCTIGYGDIVPKTAFTKMFSVAFVLVGFGFIDIILSGMVSYVLDLQEGMLLSAVRARNSGRKHDAGSYLVDVKKGRMRIRMKVGIALAVVFLCVGVGTSVLHFVEHLGWLDAFYLSIMSVTTVGYGDHAFKTVAGRLFASAWLLVSTLTVARAFLYLAELRIDKRHRRLAKWVLGRDMTVAEFLAADIDQNGSVSKSEFVVYKLKEMGKVTEKDIADICIQFHRIDSGNSGKITLMDLVDAHSGGSNNIST